MTQFTFKDFEFKNNGERYYADGYLQLDKDLTKGYFDGEIIFTDFEFDGIYNDEGRQVDETAGLMVAFICTIERAFYSSLSADDPNIGFYENAVEFWNFIHDDGRVAA